MIPLILQAAAFVCTPVAIWDSDGHLWCAEGPRIRIAGVAGRELDGSCRSNQPCPALDPLTARLRVIRAIGGRVTGTMPTKHLRIVAPAMRCVGYEMSHTRVVASCTLASGADLRCSLLKAGAVVEWASYSRRYRLGRCL